MTLTVVTIVDKTHDEIVHKINVAIPMYMRMPAAILRVKEVIGWGHKRCATTQDAGKIRIFPQGEEMYAVFQCPTIGQTKEPT